MEQGSEDWLKWRQGGIGSSDAPVIMQVSPYKTPFQLWEEKTSGLSSGAMNWAMSRGHDLEPIARANYEINQGVEMPAMLMEHSEHKFLRASLDGCNEEKQIILEIKCASKEDHATAQRGSVPEKYFPQLQHQLLVTGYKTVHYFSFDGVAGVLVEIKRDEEYLKKLLEEELKFWSFITTKTPPPYTERDYVPITDFTISTAVSEWKMLERKIEQLKTEQELLREIIEDGLPAVRCSAYGVKIAQLSRKGSVDYGKIPELRGIDLEQYRKPPTNYTRFQIESTAEEC